MEQYQQKTPLFTRTLTIILGILILGQTVFATAEATTKAPDRGFTPGKSYAISDIESIGQQSGNLMFNLPLGSLPAGRGGMSAGVNLRYDSKMWDLFTYDIERFTTTHDVQTLLKSDEGGWRYGYKYALKLEYLRLGLNEGYCETGGNNEKLYPYKLQMVLPDGGKHTLYNKDYMDYTGEYMRIFPDGRPACPSGQFPDPVTGTITYFTTDGTFLRVDLITDSDSDWENNIWTLYAPDGTTVIHNPASGISQRIKDRNGNYIDVIENTTDSGYSNHPTTYLKDQLDRKVVIEYGAATDEDWIHSSGFDGEPLKTRVKWKNITVNKAYFASEMAPSPLDQNAWENLAVNQEFRVVEKVYLPIQAGNPATDDLYYTFDYNVNTTSATDVGWGEVSRVTLPSGAYADYSYFFDDVSGCNSTTCITTEEVLLNRPVEKQLHYDKQYDGATVGETETWAYTPSITNNDLRSIAGVTVTSPDGSTTTEQYAENSAFSSQTQPEHVKGEVYKTVGADGTVVERIYRSNMPMNYSSSTSDYSFLKANRFVKYEFTSITDNSGTLTKTAIKEYSRDKNGNVTEVKEYDYVPYSGTGSVPRSSGFPTGLPSGATPARITKTEYYNDTPDSTSTTYTDTESYHLASSPRLLSLPKSMEVQNGSGTPQTRSELTYDYTSYSSNTKGGNATETKAFDSFKGGTTRSYSNPLTSTNSISTSATYDSYGNPTQTTDANGVQTTITYGSINGYTGLYPTQTEAASNYSGLKRTTTAIYDFYSGLVTSTTDEDNDVTSATEYDDLGRPTKVAAAVGLSAEVWTQTVYDDVNRLVIVKSDLETKGDARKVATQFYDQLGRVRLVKSLEDAATQSATNETDGIKVQSRYLTSGSYSYQLSSNPYRASTSSGASSEESMGWTRSKTINTGKHSEVESFSGATLPYPFLTTGYNTNSTGVVMTDSDGERTLITDQAGKQRIRKSNALGQMTDVWEIMAVSDSATVSVTFPNQSGIAYGYQTSYTYNTLSNLVQVYQPIGTSGGQTRSFSYSSLSRLLTTANPESGTISYVYDNNGNLTSKTDARPITTTYSYDALNRVTDRVYSDSTPDVTYTYGSVAPAIGKLTKVDNGFSKTEYTQFDILGKVKKSKQTTDGTAYNEMEYTYNLSGALIEEKYPSGRIVKNVLDNNGDLSMVQSKKNSSYGYWNYADNFTYTAAGAVSSMQLGNFKWESTEFNSRLQPTQIALGTTQAAYDILKLNYTYNSSGQTDNNGNILTQTITVPTVGSDPGFSAVQTYTYDTLNRIHDAKEMISTTETWKQTFDYDRYGNRKFNESLTTTLPKNCGTSPNFTVCTADNPTANTSDNHLSTSAGFTFDAAGNTIKNPQNRKFTYDGENKQIKVETVDSGGTVTGTLGEYFNDGDGRRVKKVVPGGETTIFVYDASGKMVAEYSTQLETTPQVSYLTNDHLGSPRINTDQNGAVTARHDYQPFGEEIATSQRMTDLGYNSDEIRKKFTSYERDDETDLDFAQARYYAKNLGRFNSPDPTLASIKQINPQTFNRYSYVLNSPLVYIDPFGLWELRAITNSKGEITGYKLVESKEGDNADTLLEQLGFSKKDKNWNNLLKNANKLLTKNGKDEEGDMFVKFSQMGSINNDLSFFSQVDTLMVAQAAFDKKNGASDGDGPDRPNERDCSETMMSLTFDPIYIQQYRTAGSKSPVDQADKMLEKLTDKVTDGSERSGDVLTYGSGDIRHFAKVLFKADNGNTQVFSRLGNNDAFRVTDSNAKTIVNFTYEGKTRGGVNGRYRP